MKNIDLKTYIEKHTDYTVNNIDDTYSSFVTITLVRYNSCVSINEVNKELVAISFSFITMSLCSISSDLVTFNTLKLLNSLLKKYYKNKMKEGE